MAWEHERAIPASAAANHLHVESQTGSPALSLTWGIYTFPGAVGSYTAGVTKSRRVLGGYGPNVNAGNSSDYGFLFKGGKFTTISYPGAGWTQPNGINDTGVIVGGYGATLSDQHGFKLSGTSYSSFDYPSSTGTFAFGINKPGDIVGWYFDPLGIPHGFLLSNSKFTSIDFPGAAYTLPQGINDAGEIGGFYGDNAGNTHGFLMKNGSFTTFDYPGYSQNYVSDISTSGTIAGCYGNPLVINGVDYPWQHCYVYQSGAFTIFDAPFGPAAATEIWHMNNYGVITGIYVDNLSTRYGFTATIGK